MNIETTDENADRPGVFIAHRASLPQGSTQNG